MMQKKKNIFSDTPLGQKYLLGSNKQAGVCITKTNPLKHPSKFTAD